MANCTKCSAELIGSAKFCAACGFPVARVAGAEPPPRAPGPQESSTPASATPPPSPEHVAPTGDPTYGSHVNPFASTASPSSKLSIQASSHPPPKPSSSSLAAVRPSAIPSNPPVSPLAVSGALSERGAFQQAIESAKEARSSSPPSAQGRVKPGTQLMASPPSRPSPKADSEEPKSDGADASAKKVPQKTVAMSFSNFAAQNELLAKATTPKAAEAPDGGDLANAPTSPQGAPLPAPSGADLATGAGASNAPSGAHPASQPQAAPNQAYGVPHPAHAAPNQGYGVPNQPQAAPNQGYGVPHPAHAAPNQGYGVPHPAHAAGGAAATHQANSAHAAGHAQTPHGSAAYYAQHGYHAHAPGAVAGWNAYAQAPPQAAGAYGYGVGYPPGTRVQVTWSNGQRYPATVSQVNGSQCLVVFPDGQQHWVDVQYLSPG